MGIHFSKKIRQGLVCGTALLMIASVGAAFKNTSLIHADSTNISGQGIVRSSDFNAPNYKDTLPLGNNSFSTSTNLTQQHLNIRKVIVGVKQASARHISRDDQSDYDNGQTYLYFSPSGISIFSNGHVYIGHHFVGYIDNNPKIIHDLNHTRYGSIDKPKPGIAYAIKLGNDHGKEISILVPNRYHNIYDTLVSRNDENGLAKRLSKNGDFDDASVMKNGYNWGQEGKSMQYWVDYYVNEARRQYGLKPYVRNDRLQAIANERAIQASQAYRTQPKSAVHQQEYNGQDDASDNWVHGHEFHDTDTDDATSLDISPFTVRDNSNSIDECAGDSGFGHASLTDMGQTYHLYANDTRQLAKNAVMFGMVDHDKSSHNGHRNAILKSTAHAIGVAVKGYSTKSGLHRFTFVFEVD